MSKVWTNKEFMADKAQKLLGKNGHAVKFEKLKKLSHKELEEVLAWADAKERDKKDPSVKIPKKPTTIIQKVEFAS